MMYAGFSNLGEAKAWRAQHGGWIFHADSGEAIWFSLHFTPTPILQHPATHGKTGTLL